MKLCMKRISGSVVVLIISACVYISCIFAYTFISAPRNDAHSENRMHFQAFSRRRRALAPQKTDNWTSGIDFNMCCNPGEQLNSKFECVEYNNTDFNDKFELLKERIVVDDDLTLSVINASRVGLSYDFKVANTCSIDELTVIAWSEEETHSYYISQRNGYVLELSDDRKSVVSNYSTASFCFGDVKGHYVALLCPCKEKVCVPKCCPKGFYFNTLTHTCEKQNRDGAKSYRPNITDGIEYHLTHSVPHCKGPDDMIRREDEALELKVMDNGDLMTIGKDKRVYDRKKYCIDMFSSGDKNKSFVNGFYCQNETVQVVKNEEVQSVENAELGLVKHDEVQLVKHEEVQLVKNEEVPSVKKEIPPQVTDAIVSLGNQNSAGFGLWCFVALLLCYLSIVKVVV